jgi:L-lactate dehydrogenase complex protein LldF
VTIRSKDFNALAKDALKDSQLQMALSKLSKGFPVKRLEAASRLAEFEELRDQATEIKNHTIENLDLYLEIFEEKVMESGGVVHWCESAKDAQKEILKLCQGANAKTVTKSKSMIGEEIGINKYLAENGITPIETDLGEYIIQLRDEPPSHILAPAIHLSKEQIAQTFQQKHGGGKTDRAQPEHLLSEAREKLRSKFLAADVGLTGANMLVAETGSIVLVTNEGNADLTCTLPKTHIVIASIEKIVPTLEDATTVLRVLARSATGQEMGVYTTFCNGPKRKSDIDGPREFHVILLDNGRSKLIGTEFQEMLRCIRCGACLNHCPVYKAVGGHAYGWVYSGPMGAMLIPGLLGIENASDLPNASTLCGKCESICPMRIPIPKLLRRWREEEFKNTPLSKPKRLLMLVWAKIANNVPIYRATSMLIVMYLVLSGKIMGQINWLPFGRGWTSSRDFPIPQGESFFSQYKKTR